MGLSKKPYKGTRDFFPIQKRIQDYIFKKMQETAEIFGYESYNGPLIEEVELYKAKSGEELINEQIYSFLDRGERLVAIRPEMTPTLARMVAQVHKEFPRPLRWYAIPNLMRYENPQKGRLREHWQFNCDIFGAPEGQGELEILQLAIHLFHKLGANDQHFEITLNDRSIVDAIFKKLMNLDTAKTYQLYKIVDKAKKISPESLKEMVQKLGMPANMEEILYQYLNLKNFNDLFSFLKSHPHEGQETTANNLKNITTKLESLGIINYFQYDPTIVRGLDYYTGLVFEIYDKNPENRRALCGGGAYANLLEIFGESPLPGIGFGLGDVTLTDFLQTHKLLPDFTKPQLDIYLTFQTEEGEIPCLSLAQKLRDLDLKVATHLTPIKLAKIFSLAEKKGATFVGLLGEEEIKNNNFQLKNLATKEQKTISISNISSLKEMLSQ